MEVLPDGEQFVGTRGGGMDHAAVLASRAGHALLVHFAPVAVSHVPVPSGWTFLVAHSLTTAEKSGAVRAEYNSRRTAGTRALERLGFKSFSEAIARRREELAALAASLTDEAEQRSFLHVTGEALRVQDATASLEAGDAPRLRRHPQRLACQPARPAARQLSGSRRTGGRRRASGALGARLTGAGFGGCAVVLCEAE